MIRGEFIGIIPARGGSKGIPRKNVKELCGRPLIFYTIVEALKSRYISRLVTSTEDPEIADVARRYGSEVVERPKELASDDSNVVDAVKHVLDHLRNTEGTEFEYVVLLQPTSPFRTAQDIDSAIEKLLELKGDSLVSLTEVGDKHPARMKMVINERIVDIFDRRWDFAPRQMLPKIYIRNGAIYIAKTTVIYERNSFRGDDCIAYIMPPERSINIDDPIDWIVAEILMRERRREATLEL